MALIKVGEGDWAIGLPPSTFVSDHVIKNTFPTAVIYPSRPQFTTGMTLFSLVDEKTNYLKILKNLGFTTEYPVKVAFLADNFPTDTFTNEYGETFFAKMADVASQGIRDIMQISGARSIGEAAGTIGGMIKSLSKSIGGPGGEMLKAAGGLVGGGGERIRALEQRSGTAGTISGVLAGNRVDFPQVWRNSGFSPSYTMTIRLYNPNPGNIEATKKYIVGPLAVLLALGVPRSKDGNTYSWPFFHKIKCPGIFELNPAVITNISVIKGGDQQQIAHRQFLGIVDVRIDFVSLFSSLLIDEKGSKIKNRPTLRSYLDILTEQKQTASHYYGGVEASQEAPKLLSPLAPVSTTVREPGIIPRVSPSDTNAYNDLLT